ncbi:Hypothetical Protein FCC1311_087062 [Hondaea fermentalgiana]|uniref:VWFA domain-containing protein n=1 Tax=Hondaea fermentalgiana TaxID=2315210 RepID=A0A2R5GVP6_9STRA|nr:Hypothetical Protein FCC1311_087062 [Hondaea fermentalgiana]|eukprot:GBG32481.1 Hypothetical Protein FCC1311_087062 [Hondaea fermentalgiana]
MPRSAYLGLFIAGLAAVLVGRASAACDVEVYVAIDASSAAAEASAFEIYAAFVQEAIDVANSFCTEIGETGRSARLGVTALRCDEDATLGVELLKPTPKARNIQKTLESFPDIYPGTSVCGELALAEVESYATKKANLNRRQRLLVLSDTPFYDEDSQEMKAHRDALEKAGVQVINPNTKYYRESDNGSQFISDIITERESYVVSHIESNTGPNGAPNGAAHVKSNTSSFGEPNSADFAVLDTCANAGAFDDKQLRSCSLTSANLDAHASSFSVANNVPDTNTNRGSNTTTYNGSNKVSLKVAHERPDRTSCIITDTGAHIRFNARTIAKPNYKANANAFAKRSYQDTKPSADVCGHGRSRLDKKPNKGSYRICPTPTLMPSAAVNETDGSVPNGSYSDELGVCPEGSYDTDGECFFVWDRNGNGRVLVYIICASVFLPVLLALGSLGWVGLDISLDVVASTGDLMTDIFYLTQEPYFNALLFGLSCTSVALTVLPYMLWLKRNPVRLHFGNAMLIRTERTLLLLIGSIVWWTVGFFLYAMKVLPFGRVKRTFLLDPDSGFLCGVARAWLQRINARIRGRPDSPAPRVRIEDPPFDPAAFNRMRLLEVAVESVPQFSVQLANGLLLNSWSVASALSLGFSGFLILRVVQQLIVYVALVGRSPDELPVGLGLFVEPVSTATMAIAQTQKRRQRRRRKTNKAVNPRQGHSPEEASQDQGNPVSEAVDEASSPAAQAVTPQPPNTPKSTSGTEMTQV